MNSANVALDIASRQLLDVRNARMNQTPLVFSSGNPTTEKLFAPYPIKKIRCKLTGSYTVAGSSATANTNGAAALNLITSIKVILDGKDVVYHLPGYLVQRISNLYTRGKAYRSDPTFTTGTTTFEYEFVIPINTGPGYWSLIDPTQWGNMSVEVQWGTVANLATPGGTHSLSGVQLDVDVVCVAGYPSGVPGGKGYAYPLHLIDYRVHNIAMAQPDRVVELLREHYYTRVGILTLDDGVPVDTILNSATAQIGTTNLQKISAGQMRRENMTTYDQAANETGWHILDFADVDGMSAPLLDQGLGVAGAGALPFNLVLDVNNPSVGAGTDQVVMVFDHYAKPSIPRSVA